MECKRLNATVICENKGYCPERLVILQLKNKQATPYSTHWEILPVGKKSYFAYGNYYSTITEAENSFNERRRINNTKVDCNFKPDTEWNEM